MLNLVLLCFYLRYFCTWYIRSVRATAGARRRNQKRTRGAPPSFPAAQYIQSMQCEMIQGRYCEPSERCCGHADSALITFQSVRLPAGTKVYSSKRYPRLISPDCRVTTSQRQQQSTTHIRCRLFYCYFPHLSRFPRQLSGLSERFSAPINHCRLSIKLTETMLEEVAGIWYAAFVYQHRHVHAGFSTPLQLLVAGVVRLSCNRPALKLHSPPP